MALKSIGLMFTALLFLAVPGIIYNNLNNNNLVIAQNQAVSCSTDPQTPTCVYPNNVNNQNGGTGVGCQDVGGSNPNPCTLNGASLSFLNNQSPFTQMINGNLFALFTNVNPLAGGSSAGSQTSWSGQHGPFDITGNPVYYSADCQGQPSGPSRSQTQWALGRCTQLNTDNSNVTEANVAKWNNWNTNWNTTVALQFYQLGNGTYARTCTQIAQINYTALANSPGYTYFGCTINAAASVNNLGAQPTHRSWAYLVAMPVSYGVLAAGASHQTLFVQLTSWWTNQCVPNANLKWYNSQSCQNFLQGFKGTSIGCQAASCASFVPNGTGAIIFGFLAGIILLLLGLGLNIGVGGGVSAGSNEQGSRLAQAVGIGLVVWSFLYSQFSTWFTSGILPYGLDGSLGIVSIMLSGIFFTGTFWRALSRD